MPTVSRTQTVAAAPEDVWAVVADLPRMGELSPEATGGSWVKGDGPVVGSVFKGKNKQGRRAWSTKAIVTRAAPGRGFEIHVRSFGMAVADWAYDLEAVPEGTRVTETWTDRRGALTKHGSKVVTGVSDREAFTGESIQQTLDALRDRFAQQPLGDTSAG
jgi:carbon monoxide dehydrogenase subunit G